MKADLNKPHIYIDGVAVNKDVAKNSHEMLEALINIIELTKPSNQIELAIKEIAEQAIKNTQL